MSSVKVDPGAPMNTLDMAQIVLSSIASTFKMKTRQCMLIHGLGSDDSLYCLDQMKSKYFEHLLNFARVSKYHYYVQ
jgi:hypothetical protein